MLNLLIWRGWRFDEVDDVDDVDDDDDDDSEDDIDDCIEDIDADTASIPYISIVFAKRHGRTEGRTDGGTEPLLQGHSTQMFGTIKPYGKIYGTKG